MKSRQIWQVTLAAWSCLAFSVPQISMAADGHTAAMPSTLTAAAAPIPIAKRIADVALHGDGELQGAIVDSNGRPIADAPILIGKQGKPIAKLRTDAQGRYIAGGLTPGLYQVVTHGRGEQIRVWAAGTAPASAKQGIIHVADPAIARGAGTGRLYSVFSHPLFAFAVAAATVAIPIAIEDDDDAS